MSELTFSGNSRAEEAGLAGRAWDRGRISGFLQLPVQLEQFPQNSVSDFMDANRAFSKEGDLSQQSEL